MIAFRRNLVGLLAVSTICTVTFKVTYHYTNYITNIYTNKTDSTTQHKNNKSKYTNELNTISKDQGNNITTLYQINKYKDGYPFKITAYDKLGNIKYIDELTGEHKHTTYDNGKIKSVNDYHQRSRYTGELNSITKYDEQGNITTITFYDDKKVTRREEECKDGHPFKITVYDKLGNITYIDEDIDGNKHKLTTYENGKIKDVKTYDEYNYYRSNLYNRIHKIP